MNRRELVDDVVLIKAESNADSFNHCLPVVSSELLQDFHIVDIIFKKLSFHIGKGLRNICTNRLLDFWKKSFNFITAALILQLLNCSPDISIFSMIQLLPGHILIVVCNFKSKVTASRVNYDVKVSSLVAVSLNKVVSSSESSK